MKTILALMLSGMLAMQALVADILRAAECPAVGDVVTFRNVEEVYASMSTASAAITESDLTKGEFETTAQFEARKARAMAAAMAAMAAADLRRPVLLGGIYTPRYAEYDADNERFIIRTDAWDNGFIRWRYVLCGGVLSCEFEPEPRRGLGNRAVVMAADQKDGGSYRASNAFGAEVTVRVTRSTEYGVFDEPLRGEYEASEPEWAHELTMGEDDRPAVVLPVPLQHAPELKDTMRVGVLVRPKEPFTARGFYSISSEYGITAHIIVADILCAVITDRDRGVLKTVAPGG